MIGDWFAEYATAHSTFQVAIADLAEVDLPMFDEPNHPMSGIYTKDHTKAWSQRIAAADAFIIVTPEYNYSMPPALVNAIDYLHREWAYKPVGFVGYGGVGAARAIQMEKQLVTSFNMMPLTPAVSLIGIHAPAVQEFIADEKHEIAAGKLLGQLAAVAAALQSLHLT
jgi:NAD(P)H-dependent FMN reductase